MLFRLLLFDHEESRDHSNDIIRAMRDGAAGACAGETVDRGTEADLSPRLSQEQRTGRDGENDLILQPVASLLGRQPAEEVLVACQRGR